MSHKMGSTTQILLGFAYNILIWLQCRFFWSKHDIVDDLQLQLDYSPQHNKVSMKSHYNQSSKSEGSPISKWQSSCSAVT